MGRPSPSPRALTTAAVAVLAIGLVAGAVLLRTGDGATAFTVNGRATSQASIDDELQALAENAMLTKAQNGQSLMATQGSVSTNLAGGWVGLVATLEAATQDATKHGVQITAADRSEGEVLATQSVVDRTVFEAFPAWFRDRLVARWTPVAAKSRSLLESDRAALVTAARADCASGRYVAIIVVATAAEATTLQQQLIAGADFATLARQRSLDEASGADGGDLGCLDNQQLAAAVTTAATNQPIGVVSNPVTGTTGTTLVLVRSDPPDSTLRGYAINQVFADTRATITVDPRYGTWDPKLRQIVAPPVPGARAAAGS